VEVVPVEVVALEVVPFEMVPLEAMMLHPSTTVTALETTVAATVTPSETATVTACRLNGRADRQQNPQCGKCRDSDSFRNGKVAHVLPLSSPTVWDGERSKRIHPGAPLRLFVAGSQSTSRSCLRTRARSLNYLCAKGSLPWDPGIDPPDHGRC